MRENYDNRRRALAEVVSLEAWHDELSESTIKAALHVDVVFETGRIGGEPNSPIRFRLNVKQADVVVVISESEPIGVDKATVSRDAPQFFGSIVKSVQLTAEASIEVTEIAADLRLMSVTQSSTPAGQYKWSLRPTAGLILQGRPWDANESPRLMVVDQRRDRSKGIAPSVRVEVRCRREDLQITDIDSKDTSILERAKNKVGFSNRIAAAEAYIRDRLVREGLTIKNFEDAFGEIVLAATLAEHQKVVS